MNEIKLEYIQSLLESPLENFVFKQDLLLEIQYPILKKEINIRNISRSMQRLYDFYAGDVVTYFIYKDIIGVYYNDYSRPDMQFVHLYAIEVIKTQGARKFYMNNHHKNGEILCYWLKTKYNNENKFSIFYSSRLSKEMDYYIVERCLVYDTMDEDKIGNIDFMKYIADIWSEYVKLQKPKEREREHENI